LASNLIKENLNNRQFQVDEVEQKGLVATLAWFSKFLVDLLHCFFVVECALDLLRVVLED
jgi:hypothetical protein